MNNHPSTFLYRFPQTIQALSLFVRDFQRQQQRPQKAVSKSMENWGRKPDELFLVFAWCLKKKNVIKKALETRGLQIVSIMLCSVRLLLLGRGSNLGLFYYDRLKIHKA